MVVRVHSVELREPDSSTSSSASTGTGTSPSPSSSSSTVQPVQVQPSSLQPDGTTTQQQQQQQSVVPQPQPRGPANAHADANMTDDGTDDGTDNGTDNDGQGGAVLALPSKTTSTTSTQRRRRRTRLRLRLSIAALAICHFVTLLDQLGVSSALPALAYSLETGTSTSWVSTSFLVATTALQLLHGQVAELTGRKTLLAVCLLLLGLGDLGCGFAATREQLFAFRGVAGFGAGGVSSLSMVVALDMTTEYQGLIGLIVTLSNAAGPVLGGVITQATSWRWVFRIVSIIAIPTAGAIHLLVPSQRQPSKDVLVKAKKLDSIGILLNMAATVLILSPFAGGGVDYPFSAPRFIAPVSIGVVLVFVFGLYEWKLAAKPMVHWHLFKAPHCWALYLQALLTGSSYFGNFSYLPLYFQNVLGHPPLIAGLLLLAVVVPTSIASILSGQYIGRVGNYMHCILVGFVLRVTGNGLTLLFDRNTNISVIAGALVVEGLGIGFTLQPILMGLHANNPSRDRGAATSLRNYIRTIGGAAGLILSGSILSNLIHADLYGTGLITKKMIAAVSSAAYRLNDTDLSESTKNAILDVYMRGIHFVFVYHTTCTGICLVLTLWIGNTNMKKATPRDQVIDEDEIDVEMEKLMTQLRNGRVS
jgi:predicted MFS family arabinose efflux permease